MSVSRILPFAVVLLLAAVAWGAGGYEPWAALVLEVGAAGLFLAVMISLPRRSDPEDRERMRRARATWRRMPFWARHGELGALVRVLSLGAVSPRTTEVEIRLPGEEELEAPPSGRLLSFLGHPFRRTGLGAPLLFFTAWMGLSLVPVPSELLAVASPRAGAARAEAAVLIAASEDAGGIAPGASPVSLTPFYTVRNLWLWLSFLALFYLGVELARDGRGFETFARLLFGLGIVFGAWGAGQWLLGVQEAIAPDPSAAGLRATGPFGNRNHYAAFVSMLLLCGVGFLGSLKARRRAQRGGRRSLEDEARARFFLAGLGLLVVALGLVFSLSRSGISFAIAGGAAFALLGRSFVSSARRGNGAMDFVDVGSRAPRRRRERPAAARRWLAAFALASLAIVLWIGIDPILERFELLPGELEGERGRAQVYRESLPALGDFWMTGSGLGSFRHVFPAYRSFGGELFYSWAHNDYLQLGIELGAPGLLLLLWLFAALAGRTILVRDDLAGRPDLGQLHAGFAAALVALALHSFTDFSMHMPAVMALASVIAGVVAGARDASTGPGIEQADDGELRRYR